MAIERIDVHCQAALATVAELRELEVRAVTRSPRPLMALAGLAIAQLAQALAPHARRIWIACGPGHNGGDGLEAAIHLHRAGFEIGVSLPFELEGLPHQALQAARQAQAAGLQIQCEMSAAWLQGLSAHDLCIDALLGIGSTLQGTLLRCAQTMNQSPALTLAVDLPSGLQADTGDCEWESTVHADHTLSLLRLKPGLLTGQGRDVCGQLWLDTLGTTDLLPPGPMSMGRPAPPPARAHSSHKGSHGDVAIVGGDTGMLGASVLAAHAALHAGAGRVYWCPLQTTTGNPSLMPDCMQADWRALDLEKLTVVAGCGGGTAIHQALPALVRRSARLVLDADALNAVAADARLQEQLGLRSAQQPTVITPHPQEAARLLNASAAEVQHNRLAAARSLTRRWPACTVVLKGSGTVVAMGPERLHINSSGNARLAIAGTGDVLAGLLGARLQGGADVFTACCQAVWEHGWKAQSWPVERALTASALAQSFRPPLPRS